MTTLILFSFVSFGIFWVLNYSELTEWLRIYLRAEGEEDDQIGPIPKVQRNFLFRLMSCSFCLSYHLGYLLHLLQGEGLMSFVYAFGVAALAYFLHLIEKTLLRKIL